MKAHVIHLPEAEHRLHNLMKQVHEQKFDVVLETAFKHLEFPFMNVNASHKAIVRNAFHEDLPMVLIMEDDVCFSAPGAFDYFIQNIPEDFDVYLSSVYNGEIDPVTNTVQDFAGMHCYIVHSRFYLDFLNVSDNAHIDRALAAARGKYVVCNPFVAYQMDGYSYNKGMIDQYGHLMQGRTFFK